MASPHDQPTRVQPAAPRPAPAPAAPGGLDLKTLIITAAASAAAAFICSKVWAPGTLASAAFTPVAVALFREALSKPTDVVTSALPAALPLSRRPLGGDPRYDLGVPDDDPTRVHRIPGDDDQPTQVSPALGPQGPGATGVDPVAVHAVRQRNRRRWQIAAITGLLGFVIAAVLITVPEVIAGKSSTTIFRNGNTPSRQAAPATTTTVVQQAPTDTVTTVTQPTETATTETTPTETVTQEAPATVTETVTTPSTTPSTTTTTPTTPEQRSTPGTKAEPDAVDP